MEVKRAIAYAYDHLGNVTIVLSGSEVGLLRDFVGIEDPESLLYGRYAVELEVPRFPRSLSLEFLRAGFREAGVEPPWRVLEEAVDRFDGIVGWLVFFGKSYLEGRRDIERIIEAAVQLALRELESLGQRERMILRAVAEGARSWSAVRRYLEEKLGTTVPKSSLTRAIRRLERLSLIKNYEFLDPVYREAARRLR